jgi:sulfoacetaldehyde dehydrogenase
MVVHGSIYDHVLERFKSKGCHVVSREEKVKLQQTVWEDGTINGKIVCQSP